MASLRVLEAGVLTVVEDEGRPGFAALGVTGSGALDRGALRLANRLVGNLERAPGLEILLGGLVLRASDPVWIAVTGAWGEVEITDPNGARTKVAANRATFLERRSTIRFGAPTHGLRFYLAVRGGISARAALGSCSFDQLSEIGPPPLADGTALGIGERFAGPIPPVDFVPFEPPSAASATVGLFPGPRADWFTPQAVQQFYESEWVVSPASNRIGTRLDPAGAAPVQLTRAIHDELPSEAMIAGAIQVSPSGSPTVLLADHPVTGGYPVIAVVTDAWLDVFAQLRPGQRVSFRHT